MFIRYHIAGNIPFIPTRCNNADHNLLTRQSAPISHWSHMFCCASCLLASPVLHVNRGIQPWGGWLFHSELLIQYCIAPAGMLLLAMFHFTLILWAFAVCEHWNKWMHATARNRGAV